MKKKIKKYLIIIAVLGLVCCAFFFLRSHFVASKTYTQNLDINITSVTKMGKLEVLQADIPCIAAVDKDETTGVSLAMEFHGLARFSIDMADVEIYNDQVRKRVEVVLPRVGMDIAIDRAKTDLRFFQNNLANDSIREGTELYRKLFDQAYNKICEKAITSVYYETAEKVACNLIRGFIKGLNQNIDGLVVDVHF